MTDFMDSQNDINKKYNEKENVCFGESAVLCIGSEGSE